MFTASMLESIRSAVVNDTETPHGSHPLLREAMILFDDGVEILAAPELAIMR